VQQVAANRVRLLVHDHHRRGFAALNRQVEDGVVSRVAVDDLDDVARVHRHAHGFLVRSVNHRRDLSRAARTARLVLAARGANHGGHGYVFSHCISP